MENWLYNGVELPALYLWDGPDDNYPCALIWKTGSSETLRFAMTGCPMVYDPERRCLQCGEAMPFYTGYRDQSTPLGWSWSNDGVLHSGSSWGNVEYVLWSSSDVLTPEGTLYLAGTRPVSAACDLRSYSGTHLQKLPALSGYPYVVILRNMEKGRYEAVYSANGFYMKNGGSLCDRQGTFTRRCTVDIVTAQVGAEWTQDDPYPQTAQWPISDQLSLVWTSHNILREDGTLFLAATNPINLQSKLAIVPGSGSGGDGSIRYNGAELPALPDNGLPYAYINTAMGGTAALLYMGKQRFVHNGSGLQAASGAFAMYMYDPTGIAGTPLTDWTFQTDGLEETVADPSEVQWANHDILYKKDGSLYLAGSDPVAAGGSAVTADSAAVDFLCSGLHETDSVYRVQAWVYPRGGSWQNPVAAYTSPAAFGGPAHTESHTFTGLAPGTAYEVYGVITAGGAATDHNALAEFTTAGGPGAPALTLTPADVTGRSFCLFLTCSALDPDTDHTAEVIVSKTATGTVVFEQALTIRGSGTAGCSVTGLEPLTAYSVSVDVYPASGGPNAVRGDCAVITGEEAAFGIYAGVADLARAVRGVYVGVGGRARRVKRVYLGRNGVARPIRGG